MTFAFQKMQLDAPSFYALIDTWAEMQLVVTDEAAVLIGYGYIHDIAKAFTTLVFDWEATVHLNRDALDLAPGEYGLVLQDGMLYACREQRSYPVADRAVVVAVASVVEGEEDLD